MTSPNNLLSTIIKYLNLRKTIFSSYYSWAFYSSPVKLRYTKKKGISMLCGEEIYEKSTVNMSIPHDTVRDTIGDSFP